MARCKLWRGLQDGKEVLVGALAAKHLTLWPGVSCGHCMSAGRSSCDKFKQLVSLCRESFFGFLCGNLVIVHYVQSPSKTANCALILSLCAGRACWY